MKCFETRPYIWSTYAWNMFEFAADAHDEGGSNGKSLMTYDCKGKKEPLPLYCLTMLNPSFHLTKTGVL